MTAPVKGTERDAGLDRAGKLHLAQIRATRALTVAITNESWGKALTPMMRSAVAEYMRRFRLDISEVDILGGKPYRNGYYYRRKIAELRTQGRIEWSEGEQIGHDARLDLLMECDDPKRAKRAKDEATRRMFERIRIGSPEDATHVYVVRVKLKSDGKPQEGADWITPKRMKQVKKSDNGKFAGMEEKIADPVGAEEPEKTCVTRAWRRVGLLVAAEIPELRNEEQAMDAEAEVVEAEITAIGARESAQEAAIQEKRAGQDVGSNVSPDDPYQITSGPTPTVATPARESVPLEKMTDEQLCALDESRFEES